MGAKTAAQQLNSKPASASGVKISSQPTQSGLTLVGLQQGIGNAATMRLFRSQFIQPKLTVSHPEDESEREANRVADQVMRMPETGSRLTAAHSPPMIHRACHDCEDELRRQPDRARRNEEGGAQLTSADGLRSALQLKSVPVSNPRDADEKEADEVAREVIDGHSVEISETSRAVKTKSEGSAETSPDFHSKLESSKGDGQPLDRDVRKEMGSRMGRDLGDVRIHTTSAAHEMSESINARAFTLGSDVYFRQGEYNPQSEAGKQLLAHELVHTQQQTSGLRKKVQRQGKKANDLGLGASLSKKGDLPVSDISKKIAAILAPAISKRIPGSNLEVEAKLSWKVLFGEKDAAEIGERGTQFLHTESSVKLAEHFYSIVLDAFKQDLFLDEVPKKREPGMVFSKEGDLEIFEIELEGSELEFKLAELTILGGYILNKDTVTHQSPDVQTWLNPLLDLIKAGKLSLKAELEISISLDLKPSDYLKKTRQKQLAETEQQKSTGRKEQLEKNAKEANVRKHQAKANKELVETEIRQQQGELKAIEKNKSLTPEQANQKIEALEREIADKQREADQFKETLKKEKEAMDEAFKSARKDEEAAKEAGAKRKKINKKIRQIEKKSGRLKKALYKLEQRIEKQRQRVNKIVNRFAEKAATWVEKKLVRRLGRTIALKAAELVAKVILRAIPIIGELLLLYDAAMLLWDIGVAIWRWFWNDDKDSDNEGEGDGEREGDQEGEESKDSTQAKHSEFGESETGTKSLDEGSGVFEKGGLGLGTAETGTKDTTTTKTTTGDTTVTNDKDNPPSADMTNAVPKKTPTLETGKVDSWQKPSPNATNLELVSYGASELTTEKLAKGNVYTFKLVIRYTNDNGGLSIIETNEKAAFRYVESKDGIPKFKVETPFVIKTDTRRIFFDKDYTVRIR